MKYCDMCKRKTDALAEVTVVGMIYEVDGTLYEVRLEGDARQVVDVCTECKEKYTSLPKLVEEINNDKTE